MGERSCSVDGCDGLLVAKGLCNKHYKRARPRRVRFCECGEEIKAPSRRLCDPCRAARRPKAKRQRQCYKCGSPDVFQPTGVPVCAACRIHPNKYGKKGIPVGERTCEICGERPAAHRTGPPRCAECKKEGDLYRQRIHKERICWRCGERPAAQAKGKPVCRVCLKDYSRPEPIERECPQCGLVSRRTTRLCRSCYHQSKKHPCERCGEPCDKRARICSSCFGETAPKMEQATNWRGGKTRHKLHGYVRIKVPGHPRAASDGYVREHVAVMESVIGRFLLPDENVHHKNGQRDDNRPENLELWAKSQPAGQRAVDLLAWAREIIERYEPVEGQLRLFD